MLSGKQTGEDAGECYGCMLLYSGNFKTEAVLSYSANGFSALSWNLHRLIRSHICRSAYRDTKRPVLINNWEATYFDFTGEKIIEIAKQAAELGVEMLGLTTGGSESAMMIWRDWATGQSMRKNSACRFHKLQKKFVHLA